MSSIETFNKHPLVDFEKLTFGNQYEITRLENEFKLNGWCFIKLPDAYSQLNHMLQQSEQILSAFFSMPKREKKMWKSSTAFGYTYVGHKEGIKVLTDQFGLGRFHHALPDDVQSYLQELGAVFRMLTDILTAVIVKMPTLAQSATRNSVELSPLTMLDIVHYFNAQKAPVVQPDVGLSTKEVNCVPHFDPGLFSLSILSTNEGLQLQDRITQKWIDGPVHTGSNRLNIGVIWLGEAASTLTNNEFKSGIHRVVYPQMSIKPRLTIWQEVCTKDQIRPLLSPDNTNLSSSPGDVVQIVNQPKSKPFILGPQTINQNSLMEQIEEDRGLSMSKSLSSYMRKMNRNISTSNNNNAMAMLPGGATVTMLNQPNSLPIPVQPEGETLNTFMNRIEVDRGLSMSKSGIEHLKLHVPRDDRTEDNNHGKGLFRFLKKKK